MMSTANSRLNMTIGMNVPMVNTAVALAEFQKSGDWRRYM